MWMVVVVRAGPNYAESMLPLVLRLAVLAEVIMIAFIVFIYFFIIFSISVRLVSTDATDHTPNVFLSSSV